MRIGDVIEDMLNGMLTVLKTNDRALAERLRKKDDVVDDLYTAVKLYLTQISREALDEKEGRRWADIVSFTINMEQVGDIIERVLIDLEDKKIDKHRNFSEAGMAEICDLHARLVANLRLGMSVFLNGDLKSAQELLAQKVLFRDLERAYADSHLGAPRRQYARKHRDVVAAPRPHLRLEAHQFAHLLDRLSDPRGGRRAGAHAPQGAGAPPLRSTTMRTSASGEMPADEAWPKHEPKHSHEPLDFRHLHPVRPQGRPRLRRRAGHAARARAAERHARRGRGRRARARSPPRCCTTSAIC